MHAPGSLALLQAYIGVWPGSIIVVGLAVMVFGLVGRANSESLARLFRGWRNPLISRETAERVYSADRAKLFATVAVGLGAIVVAFGAVMTVAYYVR